MYSFQPFFKWIFDLSKGISALNSGANASAVRSVPIGIGMQMMDAALGSWAFMPKFKAFCAREGEAKASSFTKDVWVQIGRFVHLVRADRRAHARAPSTKPRASAADEEWVHRVRPEQLRRRRHRRVQRLAVHDRRGAPRPPPTGTHHPVARADFSVRVSSSSSSSRPRMALTNGAALSLLPVYRMKGRAGAVWRVACGVWRVACGAEASMVARRVWVRRRSERGAAIRARARERPLVVATRRPTDNRPTRS